MKDKLEADQYVVKMFEAYRIERLSHPNYSGGTNGIDYHKDTDLAHSFINGHLMLLNFPTHIIHSILSKGYGDILELEGEELYNTLIGTLLYSHALLQENDLIYWHETMKTVPALAPLLE